MSTRKLVRWPRPLVALAVACLLVVAAPGAGAATTGPSTISFADLTWSVKASAGLVGPGPNVFSNSPENVWVDGAGQLHLRITYRNGQWLAAEVALDHSLGYGTYKFSIASPTGQLDPNVVLGLFTWSDDAAYNHREIDVEIARWGQAASTDNAQYVVQPSGRTGNLRRFVEPDDATTTHQFVWAPNRLSFASGTGAGMPIASWKYTGNDVPKAGNERTHINLWLDHGNPPAGGAEVEVVLSGFSFTPR